MTEKTKTTEEMIEGLLECMPQHYVEFADHLIAGHSQLMALELCGRSTKDHNDNVKTARSMARAPAVNLYIQALKRRVAEKSILTLEEIDEKLTGIATTDAMDIVEVGVKSVPIVSQGNIVTHEDQPEVTIKPDEELTATQKAAIKSVKVVKGELHVELHDQVKAMDMLIKRRGGYKEVKDLNVKGNVHVFAAIDDNGRGPKDG